MEGETRVRRVNMGKSGSGLFLMEMIVAVFFFMICVSVCILAFAKSDHMSRDAKNLNQAVLAAESTAEVWKAAGEEGLADRLGFVPEAVESGNVMTAQYGSFLIRVEFSDDGGGVTEAMIHVMPAEPSPADPEEVFRLETKRYERRE